MCVNGNCKDHPPTKNLDEFAKHVHKICIEGNLDDFNFENLHPMPGVPRAIAENAGLRQALLGGVRGR